MKDNLEELSISFRVLSFLGILLLALSALSLYAYAFLAVVSGAMDSNYFYSDYVYFACMMVFKCLCACVPDILAVVKFKKNITVIDYFNDYCSDDSCNNNLCDRDLKIIKARVRTIIRIFVMSIVRMAFLVGLAIYAVIALREGAI